MIKIVEKKKNKILNKIIISIILVMFILPVFSFTHISRAESEDDFSFGSMLESVKEWMQKGKEEAQSDDVASTFAEKTAPIFSGLYYAGLVVAVGTLIILGIKYATQDAQQKAELKEKLIGWAIAVAVLALALPIWKLIIKIFSNATGMEV